MTDNYFNCTSSTSAATQNVWPIWIGQYNGTAASSTTRIWTSWSDSATTTSNTATSAWGVWNLQWPGASVTTPQPIPLYIETPSQAAERERQAAARRQQEKVAAEARVAADKKAEALFRDIFGEVAHAGLAKLGYFEMRGASGQRYRLRKHATIDVMGEGEKVQHRLCIHPEYHHELPAFDGLVAQALLVHAGKEGEEKLLKTANRHAA